MTALSMTLMLFTSMPISVLAESCDHVWGYWSIQTAPTLTTTGTAERTCTKDSTHKDTKELPVLTDTTVWMKDDTRHVDPTEEADGLDTYISEYGDVEIVLPKTAEPEYSITAPVAATVKVGEKLKIDFPISSTGYWHAPQIEVSNEEVVEDVYNSYYDDINERYIHIKGKKEGETDITFKIIDVKNNVLAQATCHVTVTEAEHTHTGIEINETNFPDENFRKYVSDNCDTDKNAFLSSDEIESVRGIEVSEKAYRI